MEKKKSFRDNMQELEEIVEKLGAEIEIETAVALYEKGLKTAGKIREYLSTAEKKIRILSEEGVREETAEDLRKK